MRWPSGQRWPLKGVMEPPTPSLTSFFDSQPCKGSFAVPYSPAMTCGLTKGPKAMATAVYIVLVTRLSCAVQAPLSSQSVYVESPQTVRSQADSSGSVTEAGKTAKRSMCKTQVTIVCPVYKNACLGRGSWKLAHEEKSAQVVDPTQFLLAVGSTI